MYIPFASNPSSCEFFAPNWPAQPIDTGIGAALYHSAQLVPVFTSTTNGTNTEILRVEYNIDNPRHTTEYAAN
jgi:hypothetical protein